jgi:hypothetical protein
MTNHHRKLVDLEDVAQPPCASTALAPIADAIAQASVTLDRLADDLEKVAALEQRREDQQTYEWLLGEAEAWRAISHTLDENARGSLSAADVCAVGFARQETLAAPAPQHPDAERGDIYESDGVNVVRRVGPDRERRPHFFTGIHGPTGLRAADLARSLLLDALGYYHDDVADPGGVKDAVEGLYQQFCDDVVAALPKRGWRLEVARVRAWAAAQVPELADTIVAAGRSR